MKLSGRGGKKNDALPSKNEIWLLSAKKACDDTATRSEKGKLARAPVSSGSIQQTPPDALSTLSLKDAGESSTPPPILACLPRYF